MGNDLVEAVDAVFEQFGVDPRDFRYETTVPRKV
jgi:hypothetical protein